MSPASDRRLLRRQQVWFSFWNTTPIRGSAWASSAGPCGAFGEDVVPGCYEAWEKPISLVQVAECRPVPPCALSALDGGAREAEKSKIVNIDCALVTAKQPICICSLALGMMSAGPLAIGALDRVRSKPTSLVDDGSQRRADRRRPSRPLRRLLISRQRTFALSTICFVQLPCRDVYSQGVNLVRRLAAPTRSTPSLICHLATGGVGISGRRPTLADRTAQCDRWGRGGRPRQPARRRYGSSCPDRHRIACSPASGLLARRDVPGPQGAGGPFEARGHGRVKAASSWIAATNPADSMPRAGLGYARSLVEASPVGDLF